LQALEFQEILSSKKAKSKNELARKCGLSRVRITRIMNLLKLSPKIIQRISSIVNPTIFNFLTEKKVKAINPDINPDKR
jgi:DNA-binding Xre family transcriptional regulator